MHAFETTIYYAILISSIVLGIVFGYFTITIFRTQRRHYKALQARFLAEINLLENERTRIARDLHDELGPLLSVIRIQTSVTNETAHDELREKACQNIDYVTERLGGIARNLTPGQLINKGLDVALQDFFDQYREVSPIRMVFRYEVKSFIDTDTGLHVYRMIQELVHNSVKHSGASEIDVHLKERKKKLYILCKDNGKGMGHEMPAHQDKGIGLESLRSRTEMLGGKIHFHSTGGTEYFFEIPLTLKHG